MPDAVGSVRRRAALLACLILAVAGSAAAQEPLPNPPARPEFLSRYDFLILLAGLDISDNRFSWDAHISGDLDVVDYVVGRASVLADYEVVMGNEQQLFDPNQGLTRSRPRHRSGQVRPNSPPCSITCHVISAIARTDAGSA